MKRFLLILALCIPVVVFGQKKSTQPKLVVGIVVDQMRYDFLYRYWNKYSDGGFKYLLKNGRSYENMHYNYVPTYTGPGHAAVYTGTTPAYNGIVANDWFNRSLNKRVYVVDDPNVKGVGSDNKNGMMSPDHLLTTTITDELKIFTNKKAKVFGVALKDRGSILPAGNMADCAYWFDTKTGLWITSTFYKTELPAYVNTFNDKKLPDSYLNQSWNTVLPIDQYTESTSDANTYEQIYKGEESPVFPHDLKKIRTNYDYALLSRTPFGNSITTDFALEVLQNEQMGKDGVTDFFALSYSSTDYVGHQFGINSIEAEDTYIRLDLELKRLFRYLEKNIGKGNFVVFLTADHGVSNAPAYLDDQKIHTGGFQRTQYQKDLKEFLGTKLGEGSWVSYYENQQVYLDRKFIASKELDLGKVQDIIVDFTRGYEGVSDVIPAHILSSSAVGNLMFQKVQRGYNYERSGDVMIVLEPQWLDEDDALKGGTTHGSSYAYDTHVPFLFMAPGVKAGCSYQEADITDIAPTLAAYLHIMEPSGCTGKVLEWK